MITVPFDKRFVTATTLVVVAGPASGDGGGHLAAFATSDGAIHILQVRHMSDVQGLYHG